MLRPVVREMAAEFLGTFVLILFGCAAVAQVVLSRHTNGEYDLLIARHHPPEPENP